MALSEQEVWVSLGRKEDDNDDDDDDDDDDDKVDRQYAPIFSNTSYLSLSDMLNS